MAHLWTSLARNLSSAGARLRGRLRHEEGIGIIEVVVGALLLALAMLGLFGALDAAGSQSGTIKQRAVATVLAERGQETMRADRMQRPGANGLSGGRLGTTWTQVKVVGETSVPYTIVTRAGFIEDTTGAYSCLPSADLVKLTTTVTWPDMRNAQPVNITSLVAVPASVPRALSC